MNNKRKKKLFEDYSQILPFLSLNEIPFLKTLNGKMLTTEGISIRASYPDPSSLPIRLINTCLPF
jgi:hypothetical protein